MKKYKVIWFRGYMDLEPEARKEIINTIELEADSIDEVKSVQVLSSEERKRYETEIKYALRIAYETSTLKEAKRYVADYGSYTRFIYVEEI